MMKRAVTILIVLAAEFALFEAGLRLHAGTEAAPEFQALFAQDDRIGHVLKPGASARFSTVEFTTDIHINGAGVRDDDFGSKPPDERRVVILGDSLVLAVQVPLSDTFAKHLERRLNTGRRDRLRYRVINAGVQGYGPVEERLFFEKVASKLEPDLVIVGVYVGNDAIEAVDSAPKIHPDPASVDEAGDRAAQGLRRLVRRSIVLQIARLRAQTLAARLGTPTPERPLLTYLADEPNVVRRGLEITAECLEQIRDEARRAGATIAILLLPARFQLDDEDYRLLSGIVEGAGGHLDRDAASTRFDAALQRVGVPILDPLAVFRRAVDPQSLYFETTAHLTPRGHEVLAGALYDFLVDRRLVP